jgi:hypothetical protein
MSDTKEEIFKVIFTTDPNDDSCFDHAEIYVHDELFKEVNIEDLGREVRKLGDACDRMVQAIIGGTYEADMLKAGPMLPDVSQGN